MSTKVPTFAGHWYERLFFTKSLNHKSILVSYCSMNNSTTKELKLKFEHCEVIQGFEPSLKQCVLYEMRAFYPIFDGIGYLKDEHDKLWLVFIQVSLSPYEKHRSLCDLFHYTTHVYSNYSLYTYYRKLYNIKITFTDALLLYVSPQEKSDDGLLPKLKEEISKLTNVHLKNNLNYGVLSSQSSFHNDIKHYFPNYIKSST